MTDPRFSKYAMLLSLLKFHSLPSTDTEDNVSFAIEISDTEDNVSFAIEISDNDRETAV